MTRKTLRSSLGYTIDQTILIVAIIAILVTLIIITVGWNLINKTSGTKLASQFRQIEDANGQFYSTFRVWADQAYTAPAATADLNMVALTANTAITGWSPQVPTAQQKNFIPGFALKGTGGTTQVINGFGGTNGVIKMNRVTTPFGTLQGTYLVIQMNYVPFSEVLEAEEAVDGEANVDLSKGRVVAIANGTGAANCMTQAAINSTLTATTAGSTLATVCYAANLVQ